MEAERIEKDRKAGTKKGVPESKEGLINSDTNMPDTAREGKDRQEVPNACPQARAGT